MSRGGARQIVAAGGLLLASTMAAAAEKVADPALLDAAWTLAELGKQGEDPALLATAAEVALSILGGEPEGRALAGGWLDEARFFARGDKATRVRIDAIEAAPPGTPGAALAVARVAEGEGIEIRLGPGKTGFILRAASLLGNAPWDPPVQEGIPLNCVPARTGGLWCEVAPAAGPVVLRSAGPGALPVFVFYAPLPPKPAPTMPDAAPITPEAAPPLPEIGR